LSPTHARKRSGNDEIELKNVKRSMHAIRELTFYVNMLLDSP